MTKREKLAREMAATSGYDYDKSGKRMQNAWLHNADTEINRETATVVATIPAKVRIEDGVRATEKSEIEIVEAYGEKVDKMIGNTVFVDPLDGADSGDPLAEPETKPAETPRAPNPDEYLCSKCNSPHRKTSAIGKKHLKRQ